MLQLVILDFDGTLADTRELIVRTNRDALLAAGAHYVIDDYAQLEQGIIDDTKWDQEISKQY